MLVVDDEKDSRELISIAVHGYGHRCRLAVDALDALRLLAECPADLVISDWDMPGMTGGELCRRLRSGGDDVRYTYFIIMTAFDDRDHLLEGMSAGADDYWRKPVSFDELEARLLTVDRVVRLHRRLAERTKRRDDSMRMQAASRPVALTTVTDQMRLGEEIAGLLARARRYGRTCTLAICDLDSLEAYNDQLGSAAADSALQRVAEGMRANLRSADALFRHGEELVVLLAEQAAAEAELAMERVRAQVEQLGIPSAAGGALTLSVGLAELESADDPSGDRWIARARAALDDAKSAGPKSASSTAPRT